MAFVTTGLGAGGAEMMLFKLLARIDRARFRCAVFSLRGDDDVFAQRLRAIGMPVFAAGLGARPAVAALAALRRALAAFDPEVLQGWMYHGNAAALMTAALLPGRRRVLWSIRQSLPDLGAERRGTAAVIRICAWLSARVEAIVYNSKQGALDHEAVGYSAQRRRVVPNGFDTDTFAPSAVARAEVRSELGLEAEAPLIGCFARYHPVKDHAGLIDAAARVAAGRPEARFLLAGSGIDESNTELAAALRRHGVGQQVRLLGERSDVARLAAALDIAVCASRAEGFPNVVGEAMSCGVPCVVTDVGDCAAIVGDSGTVVPPGDPAALAAALLRLLDAGQPARTELGRAARRRIEQHYSIDAVVRAYEAAYAGQANKEMPCAA